jgi:geranylgeranyl diphosphate synthase type 3
MDDVEDNSELRRGLPVAHTVYGVPQTINTANYVYFLAVQELLKLETMTEGENGEEEGGEKKGKGKGKAAAIDLVAVVNGMSPCLG